MSFRKQRLTVTIDPGLVEAGNEAVAAGRAQSLSAWVNVALAERVERERRLQSLGEAIKAYEAKFGEIAPSELATQQRADRRSAIVVRGRTRPAPPRPRRRGAA